MYVAGWMTGCLAGFLADKINGRLLLLRKAVKRNEYNKNLTKRQKKPKNDNKDKKIFRKLNTICC